MAEKPDVKTEDVTEEVAVTSEETQRPILKQNLERDVKLNVFVIGVGNAGNQTIVFGKKEGMNVFAVNSSIKDLSDEIVGAEIPSFIVGKEARGSGKNIQKGVELWKENGRMLFEVEQFMTSCQEADLIAVVSATGGGTGPSISPEICRILKSMFPRKIVMYHGITPKNTDSNVAFSNTSYCMNEIMKLGIPYSLTDLNDYAEDANDEAFIKADRHAIQSIKAFSGSFLKMSSSQMIDENDLRTIISEPGYIAAYVVDGITSTQLEKRSMQQMIIDQIRKGPAMMIQKDGVSMQMGVIINCPDDMDEVTRTGDYNEIFAFIGHKPKNGIFENYGVTDGTTAQMVVILSGMTAPVNRLGYYINAVKEQEEFLLKKKEVDISEDVASVQTLISGSSEALPSDTKASSDDINSTLDSFFD